MVSVQVETSSNSDSNVTEVTAHPKRGGSGRLIVIGGGRGTGIAIHGGGWLL
jgi:hypothetical protein